jgi:hypothetical protein
MAIGHLHYRLPDPAGGAGTVHTIAGSGATYSHAIPFDMVARITPRGGGPAYNEWFARASIGLMQPRVPFSVNHRSLAGTRIGWVVRLIDTSTWLDLSR